MPGALKITFEIPYLSVSFLAYKRKIIGQKTEVTVLIRKLKVPLGVTTDTHLLMRYLM